MFLKTQQYKQMCHKAISLNGGILKSVSDGKMCSNKAVDNYPHALQFAPECLRLKKSVLKLLVNIKLKKCVAELILKILSLIVYCPDKYKLKECVMKLLVIL